MHFSINIQRFSASFAHDISGVFIREDEDFFEIVSPLVYCWVHHLQKEQWLPLLSTQKIPKHLVHTRNMHATYDFSDWIFDFPISDKELPYFPSICAFFQELSLYQKQADAQTLERLIDHWVSFLPFYVLQALITFIVHHEVHGKERIRFLLSSSIQLYVKTP